MRSNLAAHPVPSARLELPSPVEGMLLLGNSKDKQEWCGLFRPRRDLNRAFPRGRRGVLGQG